jgi:hypothetical protein
MITYDNKLKYVVLTFTALSIPAVGVASFVTSLVKAADTTYYMDCSAPTNEHSVGRQLPR